MIKNYFTKKDSNIHIDYLIQKFNCFVDEYKDYKDKDNYAYLISMRDSNDGGTKVLNAVLSKKDMDVLYKRVKEESVDKVDGAISGYISAVMYGLSIFNSIFDMCRIDVNSQDLVKNLIEKNSSSKLRNILEHIFNIELVKQS